MNADEIRALYVETATGALRANHEAMWGCGPNCTMLDEVDATALLVVAGLAEAGLLPTAEARRSDYHPDGTPQGYMVRQFRTDWRKYTCLGCDASDIRCRLGGGIKCCPDCDHSEVTE